jgi:sugar phosphate isomerase/epimerase
MRDLKPEIWTANQTKRVEECLFNDRIVSCYLYVITKYGYPPPAKDSRKYLEEMKTLGFKSVELEGIREEHLSEMYQIRDDVAAWKSELDLDIPIFCIVLPGISSPIESERNEALALFEKGCDVAATIGAKGVLDNAPLPPYRFPDDIPIVRHYDEDVLRSAAVPDDLQWSVYWEQLVDTYRQACDIAAARNLTYQMHPCLGVLSATTDAFLYFCDAVKRDNLRFNLDTANQFMMQDNLAFSLIRLKGLVDYIHVSDNPGDRVEHLEPGKGAINWDVFFETVDRIGYDGHFGVDVGGHESRVDDLDQAYRDTAKWLDEKIS